jgi:hypothetical protein
VGGPAAVVVRAPNLQGNGGETRPSAWTIRAGGLSTGTFVVDMPGAVC